MKFALICLALAALLPLAARAAGDSEDARLAAFFRRHLDEEFRRHPYAATRAGDHRFDDRLDDLSPAARAEAVEYTRRTLAELPKQMNYQKLTRAGQIDFEILRHDLTVSLWLAENTKPFEEDPRLYNEYLSDSVYLLLTQSSLPRAENVRNAAARIGFIPAAVAAAKVNLRRPPRVILDTAIRQNRGAIAFYEGGIFEVAGETPQLSPLTEPCRWAAASLREYQEFLEKELLPRADGDWRLGRERFVRKLDLELNSGLSADEVLREAESEADRVEREMGVIAKQLWPRCYPGKPVPPDDPAGRRAMVHAVFAVL